MVKDDVIHSKEIVSNKFKTILSPNSTDCVQIQNSLGNTVASLGTHTFERGRLSLLKDTGAASITMSDLGTSHNPSLIIGSTGAITTSAIFESTSTTKGVLIPRMTTAQRDAIATPATGLLIWNTSTTQLEDYNGAAWAAV